MNTGNDYNVLLTCMLFLTFRNYQIVNLALEKDLRHTFRFLTIYLWAP